MFMTLNARIWFKLERPHKLHERIPHHSASECKFRLPSGMTGRKQNDRTGPKFKSERNNAKNIQITIPIPQIPTIPRNIFNTTFECEI